MTPTKNADAHESLLERLYWWVIRRGQNFERERDARRQQKAAAMPKTGIPELRWVTDGEAYGRPTAIDALEYANGRLADPAEVDCCSTDSRLSNLSNVRTLLMQLKR